jgi:hypothetical protein
MESALVKNRRDLIEVKNGYFIHHLHSIHEIAEPLPNPLPKNEYRFKLRPPNDSSFSDKYNQALIRIRKAVLYTPSGLGGNQCLFGITSRAEFPDTIVRLKTSIRSNQISTEAGNHDDLAAFVHHRDKFDNNLSEALYHTGGGGMTPGVFAHEREFTNPEIMGSTAITLVGNAVPLVVEDAGGAGATPGPTKENTTATSVSFRCDNSATSIFENGILVSNPYKGGDIIFETKLFETAEDVVLVVPPVIGLGGGTAVSHSNGLYVQLEVQLLPNPTPSD